MDEEHRRRLAQISSQKKAEVELVSELMWQGSQHEEFGGKFKFAIENKRRDLTVRDAATGTLLEWVEAKFCYSDDLARHVWRAASPTRYPIKAIAADVEKQSRRDDDVIATNILFVAHFNEYAADFKYFADFRRDRRLRQSDEVKADSRAFATGNGIVGLARHINRTLCDESSFSLQFDENVQLHTYVFRDA